MCHFPFFVCITYSIVLLERERTKKPQLSLNRGRWKKQHKKISPLFVPSEQKSMSCRHHSFRHHFFPLKGSFSLAELHHCQFWPRDKVWPKVCLCKQDQSELWKSLSVSVSISLSPTFPSEMGARLGERCSHARPGRGFLLMYMYVVPSVCMGVSHIRDIKSKDGEKVGIVVLCWQAH